MERKQLFISRGSNLFPADTSGNGSASDSVADLVLLKKTLSGGSSIKMNNTANNPLKSLQQLVHSPFLEPDLSGSDGEINGQMVDKNIYELNVPFGKPNAALGGKSSFPRSKKPTVQKRKTEITSRSLPISDRLQPHGEVTVKAAAAVISTMTTQARRLLDAGARQQIRTPIFRYPIVASSDIAGRNSNLEVTITPTTVLPLHNDCSSPPFGATNKRKIQLEEMMGESNGSGLTKKMRSSADTFAYSNISVNERNTNSQFREMPVSVRLPPALTVIPRQGCSTQKPVNSSAVARRSPPPMVPIENIAKLSSLTASPSFQNNSLISRLKRLGTDVEVEKYDGTVTGTSSITVCSQSVQTNAASTVTPPPSSLPSGLPSNKRPPSIVPQLKPIHPVAAGKVNKVQLPPNLIPISKNESPGASIIVYTDHPSGDSNVQSVHDEDEQDEEDDEEEVDECYVMDKLEITLGDDEAGRNNCGASEEQPMLLPFLDHRNGPFLNNATNIMEWLKNQNNTKTQWLMDGVSLEKITPAKPSRTQSDPLPNGATPAGNIPLSVIPFFNSSQQITAAAANAFKIGTSSKAILVPATATFASTTPLEKGGGGPQPTKLPIAKQQQQVSVSSSSSQLLTNIAVPFNAPMAVPASIAANSALPSTATTTTATLKPKSAATATSKNCGAGTHRTAAGSAVNRSKDNYFIFTDDLTLRCTYKYRNGKNYYKCDICSETHDELINLQKHYYCSHINLQYIPRIERDKVMDYVYDSSLWTARPSESKTLMRGLYYCYRCELKFDYKKQLKFHLSNNHRQNQTSGPSREEKCFDCPQCHTIFLERREFCEHLSRCCDGSANSSKKSSDVAVVIAAAAAAAAAVQNSTKPQTLPVTPQPATQIDLLPQMQTQPQLAAAQSQVENQTAVQQQPQQSDAQSPPIQLKLQTQHVESQTGQQAQSQRRIVKVQDEQKPNKQESSTPSPSSSPSPPPSPLPSPLPSPSPSVTRFLCLFCNKSFNDTVAKKKHNLHDHHPKRRSHNCCYCKSKNIRNLTELLRHLCDVHGKKHLCCFVCKMRFDTKINLNKHNNDVHNNERKKRGGASNEEQVLTAGGNIGVLDDSSQKIGRKKNSSNAGAGSCSGTTADLKSVAANRKSKCNYCDRVFSTNVELGKHRRTEHPNQTASNGGVGGGSTVCANGEQRYDVVNNASEEYVKKNASRDLLFYRNVSENVKINLLFYMNGRSPVKKPSTNDLPMQSRNAQLASKQNSSLAAGTSSGSSSGLRYSSLTESGLYPGWKKDYLALYQTTNTFDFSTIYGTSKITGAFINNISKLEFSTQIRIQEQTKKVPQTATSARKDYSKTPDPNKSQTTFLQILGLQPKKLIREEESENIQFSGEWMRPKQYSCASCFASFNVRWESDEHCWSKHPNVWCSPYEFLPQQVPHSEYWTMKINLSYIGKSGSSVNFISDLLLSNRNECTTCTKCGKVVTPLSEFHKHILECGGDTAWMANMLRTSTRKQRRWRLFGSRRKRGMGRGHGLRRNIPTPTKSNIPTVTINHATKYKKGGDADTIQKMIANLPPKRTTRRAIAFDELDVFTRNKTSSATNNNSNNSNNGSNNNNNNNRKKVTNKINKHPVGPISNGQIKEDKSSTVKRIKVEKTTSNGIASKSTNDSNSSNKNIISEVKRQPVDEEDDKSSVKKIKTSPSPSISPVNDKKPKNVDNNLTKPSVIIRAMKRTIARTKLDLNGGQTTEMAETNKGTAIDEDKTDEKCSAKLLENSVNALCINYTEQDDAAMSLQETQEDGVVLAADGTVADLITKKQNFLAINSADENEVAVVNGEPQSDDAATENVNDEVKLLCVDCSSPCLGTEMDRSVNRCRQCVQKNTINLVAEESVPSSNNDEDAQSADADRSISDNDGEDSDVGATNITTDIESSPRKLATAESVSETSTNTFLGLETRGCNNEATAGGEFCKESLIKMTLESPSCGNAAPVPTATSAGTATSICETSASGQFFRASYALTEDKIRCKACEIMFDGDVIREAGDSELCLRCLKAANDGNLKYLIRCRKCGTNFDGYPKSDQLCYNCAKKIVNIPPLAINISRVISVCQGCDVTFENDNFMRNLCGKCSSNAASNTPQQQQKRTIYSMEEITKLTENIREVFSLCRICHQEYDNTSLRKRICDGCAALPSPVPYPNQRPNENGQLTTPGSAGGSGNGNSISATPTYFSKEIGKTVATSPPAIISCQVCNNKFLDHRNSPVCNKCMDSRGSAKDGGVVLHNNNSSGANGIQIAVVENTAGPVIVKCCEICKVTLNGCSQQQQICQKCLRFQQTTKFKQPLAAAAAVTTSTFASSAVASVASGAGGCLVPLTAAPLNDGSGRSESCQVCCDILQDGEVTLQKLCDKCCAAKTKLPLSQQNGKVVTDGILQRSPPPSVSSLPYFNCPSATFVADKDVKTCIVCHFSFSDGTANSMCPRCLQIPSTPPPLKITTPNDAGGETDLTESSLKMAGDYSTTFMDDKSTYIFKFQNNNCKVIGITNKDGSKQEIRCRKRVPRQLVNAVKNCQLRCMKNISLLCKACNRTFKNVSGYKNHSCQSNNNTPGATFDIVERTEIVAVNNLPSPIDEKSPSTAGLGTIPINPVAAFKPDEPNKSPFKILEATTVGGGSKIKKNNNHRTAVKNNSSSVASIMDSIEMVIKKYCYDGQDAESQSPQQQQSKSNDDGSVATVSETVTCNNEADGSDRVVKTTNSSSNSCWEITNNSGITTDDLIKDTVDGKLPESKDLSPADDKTLEETQRLTKTVSVTAQKDDKHPIRIKLRRNNSNGSVSAAAPVKPVDEAKPIEPTSDESFVDKTGKNSVEPSSDSGNGNNSNDALSSKNIAKKTNGKRKSIKLVLKKNFRKIVNKSKFGRKLSSNPVGSVARVIEKRLRKSMRNIQQIENINTSEKRERSSKRSNGSDNSKVVVVVGKRNSFEQQSVADGDFAVGADSKKRKTRRSISSLLYENLRNDELDKLLSEPLDSDRRLRRDAINVPLTKEPLSSRLRERKFNQKAPKTFVHWRNIEKQSDAEDGGRSKGRKRQRGAMSSSANDPKRLQKNAVVDDDKKASNSKLSSNEKPLNPIERNLRYRTIYRSKKWNGNVNVSEEDRFSDQDEAHGQIDSDASSRTNHSDEIKCSSTDEKYSKKATCKKISNSSADADENISGLSEETDFHVIISAILMGSVRISDLKGVVSEEVLLLLQQLKNESSNGTITPHSLAVINSDLLKSSIANSSYVPSITWNKSAPANGIKANLTSINLNKNTVIKNYILNLFSELSQKKSIGPNASNRNPLSPGSLHSKEVKKETNTEVDATVKVFEEVSQKNISDSNGKRNVAKISSGTLNNEKADIVGTESKGHFDSDQINALKCGTVTENKINVDDANVSNKRTAGLYATRKIKSSEDIASMPLSKRKKNNHQQLLSRRPLTRQSRITIASSS